MPQNANIVFVDDDLNVLRGLRRRMMGVRPQWTIRFFESAELALVGLAEHPADVVVSDMRMPSMDGAEFLRIVAQQSPKTSRILLSGYADEAAIQDGTAATHHFLTKPCSDVEIIHAIERGLILRNYLSDPVLVDLLTQTPEELAWPPTFQRLHTILQFRGPHSLAELNDFAADHPALTALALELAQREQLVAFGPERDFISLVKLLGFDSIKALCVLWSQLGQSEQLDARTATALLHRPLVLGQMAANIARIRKMSADAIDQVRAAALLCHIGEIIISRLLPTAHLASRMRADTEGCDIISAEISEMGIAHPAISACICSLWGFSHEIVESIAFHHRPEAAPTANSDRVLIVYAAQHFARKAGIDGVTRAAKYDLAQGYIRKCGAANDWAVWEKTCIEKRIPQEYATRTAC
jgi:response regulator RpfG family c-di-GMP phosphodiesterase